MSEWENQFGSLESVYLYQNHEPQTHEEKNEDCVSIASFSTFNIKRTPPRVQEMRFFGKIRAFNTFTKLDWIYLSVSLLALTVGLGFTITSLTTVNPNESGFTFGILMLINILFCYHYVIHSTFTECWDELLVFVGSNIIILIYCVLNYFYFKDISDQYLIKMVRLILVCILSPFLIIAGCVQSCKYFHSNNYSYYVMGHSGDLQNACWMFFFCVSLLKFDFQLQISMLILNMSKGVTSLNLYQKIVLGSGIPITVIFVIVGYLGLRFENIPLMVVFYMLGLLENVYITYKIIDTAEHEFNIGVIRDSTFSCGCFALFISVLLFISTLYFIKYYFGKGLKERMFRSSTTMPPPEAGNIQYNTFT